MIINRNTSDALLVDSLRLYDSAQKPIVGVTEFNTDTLGVTFTGGGTATASDFWFYANDEQQLLSLAAILQPESEDLLYQLEIKPNGLPKKAMDDADTGAEELLTLQSPLASVLVQCTNCSTYFLMFVSADGNLWSSTRTNPTDKWLTATQLDKDSIICDNCDQAVAYVH